MIRFHKEKWGNSLFTSYEHDFVDCIRQLEVEDLPYSGQFHTWSNKQIGDNFVSKKLDRVMSKFEWLNIFVNTSVIFMEGGVSDHSPAPIKVEEYLSFGPKPFNFF